MDNEVLIEIPVEYKPLFDKGWREAAIYGGRFSLKSHTVARYLLIRGRMDKIRIGCFREFQSSIAESSHQLLSDLIKHYKLNDYKVTDKSIINTVTGTDFIFKGLWNNEQSIKSIEGIDIAWVEEAQTITTNSIDVLTPTVRKDNSQIIYTYNRLLEDDPVHKRLVLEGRPNTLIINVNYDIALKYKMMPEVIRIEMEDDKLNRPILYKTKWLGEPTGIERKIYKDWAIIDEIPHEARLERYGMDFGYTNDPTSIVAIYYYNGGYILDEITYLKGLKNKQIADILKAHPEALVVADSAEPKSIDEIYGYDISIVGAEKGADSIRNGIAVVQAQRISITKRSINIIREYNNYLFREDRDGKIINVPEGGFDHCFAPESLIHTTKGQVPIHKLVGKEGYLYSRDGKIERFYNVRPTRVNAETVKIEFNDGQILEVTPDHLLLKPNGEWVESGLLVPKDMIQSDIYERNIHLQWLQVYKVLISYLLQRASKKTNEMVTSLCLGNRKRTDTKGLSYSPYRWESEQQHSGQSRTKTQVKTSQRPYDTREKATAKGVDKDNKSTVKEVAWVKKGKRMAQVAWEENIRTERSYFKRLLSLPQDIHNKAVCRVRKILSPELQNESSYKKVKRITRGFCPVTYNLEVENTHCLLVDGVIAHNSMDALRYGLTSLIKDGSSSAEEEMASRLMSRLKQAIPLTK